MAEWLQDNFVNSENSKFADISMRGEPDGGEIIEGMEGSTETFSNGTSTATRRSMVVVSEEVKKYANNASNGGVYYSTNTTTISNVNQNHFFSTQRPYSYYDNSKKFYTLNESVLRKKRNNAEGAMDQSIANLQPHNTIHHGDGGIYMRNNNAPLQYHQQGPPYHPAAVMQVHRPPYPQPLPPHHHANPQPFYMAQPPQPLVLQQPAMQAASLQKTSPGDAPITQLPTLSPTAPGNGSGNKIKRVKRSGFLGLRVYGRFNKNNKNRNSVAVDGNSKKEKPNEHSLKLSSSLDSLQAAANVPLVPSNQFIHAHASANDEIPNIPGGASIANSDKQGYVGRSNSCDVLNFEQKRKLIASSLSLSEASSRGSTATPPLPIVASIQTMHGSRPNSPLPGSMPVLPPPTLLTVQIYFEL